jgi:hypothetical protein
MKRKGREVVGAPRRFLLPVLPAAPYISLLLFSMGPSFLQQAI